jgi:hypothetical protein
LAPYRNGARAIGGWHFEMAVAAMPKAAMNKYDRL